MRLRILVLALTLSLLLPGISFAQVTAAEYERAAKLRDSFQGLAVNIAEPANAIEKTSRFWYRKSVTGGNEFVVVDAEALVKRAAFDHERLAVSLSAAVEGQKYTAQTLPFNTFRFVDNETAITFSAAGSNWRCDLSEYACRKTSTGNQNQGQPAGASTDEFDESPTEFGNDVEDGMTYLSPQEGQNAAGPGPQAQNTPKASPDGKWEALILNFNIFIRPKGKTAPADALPLSSDGSEGNYYTLASIAWSPDGDSSRGLPCASGVSPRSSLRRNLAGGSASAQALHSRLREARGRAEHRAAGVV